jgi:L-ribulose-5-phosphate 3-epimerase
MPATRNKSDAAGRLAVCSWSLRPANPRELIERLSATGIPRVQLALDPLRKSPGIWDETGALLRREKIQIVSGMFGCLGENYSTLENIRVTGGIAPDATWEKNLENIREIAGIAASLSLRLVTFHAGFLPQKKTDSAFAKMSARLGAIADIFAAHQIALGLETGQETAAALAAFLKELNRPDVGVNFDPANMILYDKGNPVEGLRILSPWLRQVHIKDAVRTKIPGTWGTEAAAGSGEVDWTVFFDALREVNFTGDLVIEREAGDRRVPDILAAREMVRRQLEK